MSETLQAAKAEYERTKEAVNFINQHSERDSNAGIADWEYAEATVIYINTLEARLRDVEAERDAARQALAEAHGALGDNSFALEQVLQFAATLVEHLDLEGVGEEAKTRYRDMAENVNVHIKINSEMIAEAAAAHADSAEGEGSGGEG